MQYGVGLVHLGSTGRRSRVVRRAEADYILCAEEGGAGGEDCLGDVEERYEAGDGIGACGGW